MARAKAVNTRAPVQKAEDLVALGAPRLADLILTQTKVDPVFGRTVRMALAAKDDPSALAHEINKRLKTIRRSTRFLDWDKVRPLAREREQLRQSIIGPLAQQSPRLAAEQMRLFLTLAEAVYERSDDSNGYLGDVFRQGGEDLGALWVRSGDHDPAALAADVLSLIEGDGYGVFDELPESASPALGVEGRAAMRRLLLERQAGLSGEKRRHYDYKVNWLLPALADLDDDVDAYIATVDPQRRNSLYNAQVAQRLINHDRAEEALEWLGAPTDRGHNEREMAGLRLLALEKLKQPEKAQAERRLIFERWLDPDILRAWLKGLPDFEDFEAEQEALDFVGRHPAATLALAFLVDWSDLKRASELVRNRLDHLDGRDYTVLRPAAETLAIDYPAAATILYRRLVSGVLDRANSKYYPYAARDFLSAAALADAVIGASISSHEEWLANLKQQHGRKIGFWILAEGKSGS
jgi:integrase